VKAGVFIVEITDEKGNVIFSKNLGHNTMLNTGKAYLEDTSLGLANWRDPGNDSYPWSGFVDKIYMHVGDSTDTNTGIIGPSGSNAVPKSGAWQGVDPEDFRLSHWIASKKCTVSRPEGSTITKIYATFTNSELGTGEVIIREMGIGLDAEQPDSKPMYNISARPKAMLIRKICYDSSGNYWVDAPVTRPAGQNFTLTHMFGVVEP